jgi:hypothetical protein
VNREVHVCAWHGSLRLEGENNAKNRACPGLHAIENLTRDSQCIKVTVTIFSGIWQPSGPELYFNGLTEHSELIQLSKSDFKPSPRLH